MRLGRNQLRTLVVLGSPTMSLVVPGKAERAMIKRGLLRCADSGGFACITPLGLRVLANEMEAGRIDDAVERIRKDVEHRKSAQRG
jgi:hypothetical protein